MVLPTKLLSYLAVVSAIVVASYETSAEIVKPYEGSKLLATSSSAISQHDTMRSLRSVDAAATRENEERAPSTKPSSTVNKPGSPFDKLISKRIKRRSSKWTESEIYELDKWMEEHKDAALANVAHPTPNLQNTNPTVKEVASNNADDLSHSFDKLNLVKVSTKDVSKSEVSTGNGAGNVHTAT